MGRAEGTVGFMISQQPQGQAERAAHGAQLGGVELVGAQLQGVEVPGGPLPGAEFRSGELLGGRYRLESVLGRGALGVVWRARHITMGRQVAVKVLHPQISAHPAIRRRLIQRVHLAQQLSHPNNCRLLDFGQSRGSLFVVMELLGGGR